MTFHYVVPDSNGRYLHTGSCVSEEGAPEGAIEVAAAVDPRHYYHDHQSGKPVTLPGRPSQNHTFDYSIKAWIDSRTPTTEWVVVRAARDLLLKETDHTQLADSPKDRLAWARYRRELRDITAQSDPFNITWPIAPTV